MSSTSTPVARQQRHDPGQSLAELAIIAPVLLLLFLGILQVGFILFTQVGITNAAREAARNASAIPVATAAEATTAATTYYGRLTDASTGFLKRNVGGYDPARLDSTPGTGTRVCYYSFTDASGAPAVMARVDVQYRHPLFVPLLGWILDGLDGAADGGLRLNAIEDIRVGNAVLLTTDIGDVTSQTCNP